MGGRGRTRRRTVDEGRTVFFVGGERKRSGDPGEQGDKKRGAKDLGGRRSGEEKEEGMLTYIYIHKMCLPVSAHVEAVAVPMVSMYICFFC